MSGSQRQLPAHWPFRTEAERRTYDEQRAAAYAALAAAHERFLAAIAERKGGAR